MPIVMRQWRHVLVAPCCRRRPAPDGRTERRRSGPGAPARTWLRSAPCPPRRRGRRGTSDHGGRSLAVVADRFAVRAARAPFGVGAPTGQRRSEQPHAEGEPGARGVRRPATLRGRRLQAHVGHLAAAARHRSLHGQRPTRSSSGPPASGASRTTCCGPSRSASPRGTSTRSTSPAAVSPTGAVATWWTTRPRRPASTAVPISRRGHDYQADYAPGSCPKTFSIAGVMSWQDPTWGRMKANQNGTFPFNRRLHGVRTGLSGPPTCVAATKAGSPGCPRPAPPVRGGRPLGLRRELVRRGVAHPAGARLRAPSARESCATGPGWRRTGRTSDRPAPSQFGCPRGSAFVSGGRETTWQRG